MNPSGAAEDVGDPTVDGMCRRAQLHWDVGAYYQLNVMSIRGTYSADLAKTEVVNLPENDEWIRRIASKARLVVVGWGVPGQGFLFRPQQGWLSNAPVVPTYRCATAAIFLRLKRMGFTHADVLTTRYNVYKIQSSMR
jgi:hypothetical protein